MTGEVDACQEIGNRETKKICGRRVKCVRKLGGGGGERRENYQYESC